MRPRPEAPVPLCSAAGTTVGDLGVDTFEEAIAKANSVDFGLHSAAFSNDVTTCHRLIDGLDSGSVLINDSTDYRLDSMPFGGVKGSGLRDSDFLFPFQPTLASSGAIRRGTKAWLPSPRCFDATDTTSTALGTRAGTASGRYVPLTAHTCHRRPIFLRPPRVVSVLGGRRLPAGLGLA